MAEHYVGGFGVSSTISEHFAAAQVQRVVNSLHGPSAVIYEQRQ